MKHSLSLGLSTVALWAATAAAQPSFAVFGDNIADPGNIPGFLIAANASGEGPFDANFPASPPNFGNRFSNGLTAAELLGPLLGYGGAATDNRAVGNAFSDKLPVSLAGNILLGSGSAIPAPIGRELTPLNDTDIRSQVTGYIADRRALGQSDMMLLYPSANDGALALNTIALTMPAQNEALQIITQGATTNAVNTIGSARALLDAGAGTILIPNLPNIGQTPAAQAGALSGQQLASLFSTTTNDALVASASTADTSGGTIIIADSFTLTNDIIADPAKYGFSDVTTPCSLAPQCVAAGADVQDQFLFWDPFFPTAAGHRVYAAFLADTVNAPATLPALAEIGRYTVETAARDALDVPATIPDEWTASAAFSIGAFERDAGAFSRGYGADAARFSLGLWRGIGDRSQIGGTLSYSETDVSFDTVSAAFTKRSMAVDLAGRTMAGPLRLTGSGTVSLDQYDDFKRFTAVAGQTSQADTEGTSFAVMGEAALPVDVGLRTHFAPLVRLGFAETKVDGFTESGAVGLSQRVEELSTEHSFAAVGLEIDRLIGGDDGTGRLWARALYQTSFDDGGVDVRSALTSLDSFERSATTAQFDEDYGRIEAGLNIVVGQRWDLTLEAQSTVGTDDFDDVSGQVRLSYRF